MDLNSAPEPLELDREGCLRLADSLPDTPMTARSIAYLRQGTAKAWIAGPVESFRAAVIQLNPMPEEPLGFGTDAAAIFAVLQSVHGWARVEVEGPVAGMLAKLVGDRMELRTHIEEAVYYHMLQPVKVVRNQAVRVLTSADEVLLEPTYDEFFSSGGCVPALEAVPGEVGVDAGAVVDGRVVSFVSGYQSTARYGEMSACTLAAYRSHGFAVAAGSIVAGYLQERGLIPIWSTEAGNPASMRVAEKLGFVEILPRRRWVVTER